MNLRKRAFERHVETPYDSGGSEPSSRFDASSRLRLVAGFRFHVLAELLRRLTKRPSELGKLLAAEQ